jgi:hypothetical protein
MLSKPYDNLAYHEYSEVERKPAPIQFDLARHAVLPERLTVVH